jgi:TetR/AcrR family transcriptional regulator, transcriptional repressor for nem operon
MAMSAPSTRDALVTAARDLFAARGYERTTLAQVANSAGALTGSLYHFFPSKSKLLEAVLESYLWGLDPVVIAPAFSRTGDPIEQVFAVLADYRERVLSTNFAYRCPIGSLALEIANEDERARNLVDQNFTAWKAAIQSRFDLARERFKSGVDTPALAALALTVMEGAVMQAAVQRRIDAFDLSISQFRAFITSLQNGSQHG